MPDMNAGTTGDEAGSEYEAPCATDLEVTGGTVETASMLVWISH